MLTWSTYFQNPTYMELTRKHLIAKEYRPVILSFCGIEDGMRVLDVGCGTGYFSRYLLGGEKRFSVTGIDLDGRFIDYATQKTGAAGNPQFVQGDALSLPFPDGSFDAVVSHTFLTSVPSPQNALKEMMRVCKHGGSVCSVTAMAFGHTVSHSGHYPPECGWQKPLQELEDKLWTMYETVNPIRNYLNDLSPSELPHIFASEGLKNVSAFPVGKLFSLSNAVLTEDEKEEYIRDTYQASKEKLDAYMRLDEARALFSSDDAERYLALLDEKTRFLLDHLDDNGIWEWNGGANVLVTGLNAY